MAIVIYNCICGSNAKVYASMSTSLPPSRRHGFAVMCVGRSKGCRVGLGKQAATVIGAIRLWNRMISDMRRQERV